MLTEKDYCDYETCVALRELGYNAPQRLIPDYFGVFEEPQYDENIHLYDAQKWLREEKGILVYPEKNSFGWYYAIHYNVGEVHQLKYSEECDSYEEALAEGIKEAVKFLKGEVR
jgi:hypothetical protein